MPDKTEASPSLESFLDARAQRLRTFFARNPLQPRELALAHIPILRWLPTYQIANLQTDLIAGATIWGVGVPTAMAYAGIAGVPPEAGLYSALLAFLAYSIFSTSRHVKVSASSTMAVMSAAVVAPIALGDAATYWTLTAGLALVVGIMLLVAGVVRLGFIADFLSKPVVTGFVFGLALVILVGQLPKLFGISVGTGNVFQQFFELLTELNQTNPYTLAVGAGSLALILLLKRYVPRVPPGLVALAVGIVISALFQLNARYGVSIVGEIPTGLPHFGLPGITLFQLPFLIAGAGGIVFLALGESLGSARSFASRHHYTIDADQELIALGMANVGTGLSQGMTVDASLSISATADSAGAKTQLAGLVTAGLVLVTILFIAPLFTNLPNAVLGAIVISSVIGLMDMGELRRYLAGRRTDFFLALVALFGVILSDVLTGLAIAVLLSLLIVLYRASRPSIAVLARVPGQHAAYGDMQRHPEYQEIPGLILFRPNAPLFFANANVADKEIRASIAARPVPPRAILIDLGATSDLDIASNDMLMELVSDLRAKEIEVLLAQVRGSVRDRMRRTGLMQVVGEDHIFFSVEGAVHDYLEADSAASAQAAQNPAAQTPASGAPATPAT